MSPSAGCQLSKFDLYGELLLSAGLSRLDHALGFDREVAAHTSMYHIGMLSCVPFADVADSAQ
jgi:hypothetical protein